MQVSLEKSWQNMLSDEFEKPYFLKLVQFVRLQYQNNTLKQQKIKITSNNTKIYQNSSK